MLERDAIQVRIKKIDDKAISKKSPIDNTLEGKNIVILLSPFVPNVTPLSLSATIDAFQAAGANVTVAILSNYIYNERTEKGIDISKLDGSDLQDILAEGESLLKEKLAEEFNSKLNPGVTFDRVIKDHDVGSIYGKELNCDDSEPYVTQYKESLQRGGEFVSKLNDTVTTFVEKHYKTVSAEIRKNNSEKFLELEGPQYALLSQRFDYIAYMAPETLLLQACREFVSKEERAGFIECNISQKFVAGELSNAKLARLRQNGGGISKIEYSISSIAPILERQSDGIDRSILRSQLLEALEQHNFSHAITLVGSIEPGNDPSLIKMVNDLTAIISELIRLQQDELVAAFFRILNGFGKNSLPESGSTTRPNTSTAGIMSALGVQTTVQQEIESLEERKDDHTSSRSCPTTPPRLPDEDRNPPVDASQPPPPPL